MRRITCPKCLEIAQEFIVPLALAEEGQHCLKDHRNDSIIARNTKAALSEDWRQQTQVQKRAAIWKPDHDVTVTNADTCFYTDDNTATYHVAFANHTHGNAKRVLLCEAPDCLSLAGPGAEAHIAADAKGVAERNAKEHYAEFAEARKEANSREVDSYCKQLTAAFSALGFEVSTGSNFMDKHATSIKLNPDDAAKILDALGATTARRPVEPMPIWAVRYGVEPSEDKEPLLLGARNEAAVKVHMMEVYCDERVPDGPNVPLVPEKLHIERVEEPPPLPKKSDAA